MNCQCKNNFCEKRQCELTEINFKYCQGTSGLPKWKEDWYLAILDKNTGVADKLKKENSLEQEKGGVVYTEPSLAQKALNFGTAMVDFALSGFATVSQEEQGRRLEICHGCEAYDKDRDTCLDCGCRASWKSKITSSQCPRNKWQQ